MSSSSSPSSSWATLSLPPHSSREVIRAQYKRLALQYHPDKNPGDRAQWATEKMTELSLAYERAMDGGAATGTGPSSSLFSYATPPLFANRAAEKDQGKATTRTRTRTARKGKTKTTTTPRKRKTVTKPATSRQRTTGSRKKKTPTQQPAKQQQQQQQQQAQAQAGEGGEPGARQLRPRNIPIFYGEDRKRRIL